MSTMGTRFTCGECGGHGSVMLESLHGSNYSQSEDQCAACAGHGYIATHSIIVQVGWYSPSLRRFNQMWEVDPSAPDYKGDAVAAYVARQVAT